MSTLELIHGPLLLPRPGQLDRPALIHGSTRWSYRNLRARSFAIAAWLRERGVRRQDRVVLSLPKRPATVASLHALLMLGAIAVPADARWPARRLSRLIADAGPRAILTPPEKAATAEASVDGTAHSPQILVFPEEDSPGLDQIDSHANLPAAVEPDDVALILYTSGTTSAPKGVTLTHRNVTSFLAWAVREFHLTDQDRLVSHAPFHFDLSTLDLFGAARAGASTLLLDETAVMFPAHVAQLIADEKATVWYSVPSALIQLLNRGSLRDRDLSSLRLVLFAGEVFPLPPLRQLMKALPDREFANLYGPTETNVCTCYRLPGIPGPEERDLPIGKPCEHLQVEVLNEKGENVPPGEQGEIVVAGVAVTPGYWGKREESEACRSRGNPASYRTGDFAYLDSQGDLRFLGRRDEQVKIRGHRTELSEVDGVLASCPGVSECKTLVTGEGTSKTLVAFVVTRSEVDTRALRRHCLHWLPRHAVPSSFLQIDALPRTGTGKIDREALCGRLRESTGGQDKSDGGSTK